MRENLPVNSSILRWARESRGLSIAEVAKRMRRAEREISAWESGESSPTYSQLEKLAYEILKRPVALFFFPEIPKEDNQKTDFRTLPEILIERLPTRIISLYRKAKAFQFNLEELYEEVEPGAPSLINYFKLDTSSNIEMLAGKIREKLAIPIENQFGWHSIDKAFKAWRSALEDAGVFIFKDGFREDDYSGFCIYHKKFPIIYINNSMPLTRQIFTIFHELGHLLLHSGGVDFNKKRLRSFLADQYSDYEMLCNKFANAFLIPSSSFEKENLTASEEQVGFLANKYSVSREVILRNLLDRHLVSRSLYEKLSKKWINEAKQKRKKEGGGDYYRNTISYLGEKYIRLAFSKYYQNKISIDNLSEVLNVRVGKIPTLEHYLFDLG